MVSFKHIMKPFIAIIPQQHINHYIEGCGMSAKQVNALHSISYNQS